jgi:hypothetical protein
MRRILLNRVRKEMTRGMCVMCTQQQLRVCDSDGEPWCPGEGAAAQSCPYTLYSLWTLTATPRPSSFTSKVRPETGGLPEPGSNVDSEAYSAVTTLRPLQHRQKDETTRL